MDNQKTATPQTIETEEFYDLMQAYRFADAANQIAVADRFGAIVDHVDAKLAARDELVKALQCAQKLLDKDISYVDATAVLPFESHGQAINHVGEARRVIVAALAAVGAA